MVLACLREDRKCDVQAKTANKLNFLVDILTELIVELQA